MKIVILTIVVSLYVGNSDTVSSEWITINMDSMSACSAIVETMNVKTIVDDRFEWEGNSYITSVFCDTKIIEVEKNEND